MQYIELDLAKNEAVIRSVDGELAEGNVGSVELHIINPPSDWVSGSVWATFSKGSTQLSHLSVLVDSKYVTDVPAKMFEDDSNFGIFVWCIIGESYVETRRIARVSLAETGVIPATTEKLTETSTALQWFQKLQTMYDIVENAEKDRYQKYYKAEGLTEKEIASDDFESREMKFLRKEGDRQTAYGVAEKKRDDDYNDAESSRYNRYSSAEADRNGRYVVAEAGRNSAESVRQTNEESRQSNENARQEAERKREETIKSLAKVATSGSYNDLTDKPEILNENIVQDIDNISGDEEKEVIPSARAVKVHTSFVSNEIIRYVDRNILNKIVNDLTVPVEEDAIPTARCTQKYIEDTASEIVTHIETTLENIIKKYGLGGDEV